MSYSSDEEEKIVIPPFETKYNELPNELLQKTAFYAHKALMNPKNTLEAKDKEACLELASLLNKDAAFEDLGQGEWQCIIGQKFASSLTYDIGVMAFFELTEEGKVVLVFKSG